MPHPKPHPLNPNPCLLNSASAQWMAPASFVFLLDLSISRMAGFVPTMYSHDSCYNHVWIDQWKTKKQKTGKQPEDQQSLAKRLTPIRPLHVIVLPTHPTPHWLLCFFFLHVLPLYSPLPPHDDTVLISIPFTFEVLPWLPHQISVDSIFFSTTLSIPSSTFGDGYWKSERISVFWSPSVFLWLSSLLYTWL